jgi:hypothetical protein
MRSFFVVVPATRGERGRTKAGTHLLSIMDSGAGAGMTKQTDSRLRGNDGERGLKARVLVATRTTKEIVITNNSITH